MVMSKFQDQAISETKRYYTLARKIYGDKFTIYTA